MKKAATPLDDEIIELIIKLREAAGVSQRQLSEKLGRGHVFMSRIERNLRPVSAGDLVLIAEALGTKGWQLLRRVEEAHTSPKK